MEVSKHKPFMIYIIGWSLNEAEDELLPRLLSFMVDKDETPDSTADKVNTLLKEEQLHDKNIMVLPEEQLYMLTRLLSFAQKEMTEKPDDATIQ